MGGECKTNLMNAEKRKINNTGLTIKINFIKVTKRKYKLK